MFKSLISVALLFTASVAMAEPTTIFECTTVGDAVGSVTLTSSSSIPADQVQLKVTLFYENDTVDEYTKTISPKELYQMKQADTYKVVAESEDSISFGGAVSNAVYFDISPKKDGDEDRNAVLAADGLVYDLRCW